jgi:polyisoprenoid-binding protein YceI
MKNFKLFTIALATAVSLSVSGQTKKINPAKSTIDWTGKKVTGQHVGTINLKEGALVFKGNALKGGTFTADMSTIVTTDLEGDSKKQLEGHLRSEDFFGIEKFKTATLVFKKIKSNGNDQYAVTADLTIKGITKPITFNITVKGNTAKTVLNVDRTKYGIKYGSGSFFSDLGDKTISDEFVLDVSLVF